MPQCQAACAAVEGERRQHSQATITLQDNWKAVHAIMIAAQQLPLQYCCYSPKLEECLALLQAVQHTHVMPTLIT